MGATNESEFTACHCERRRSISQIWLPCFFLLLATCNFVYTVVSQKSTHGCSTVKLYQRGGWVLFQVFTLLTMKEHPPMSCLAQVDALEANNWTNYNVIEPPVVSKSSSGKGSTNAGNGIMSWSPWAHATHHMLHTTCCAPHVCPSVCKHGTHMLLYNYHHSTKLYGKISRVCCRLYCYECAARLTMPKATNEWYFFWYSLVLWW